VGTSSSFILLGMHSSVLKDRIHIPIYLAASFFLQWSPVIRRTNLVRRIAIIWAFLNPTADL